MSDPFLVRLPKDEDLLEAMTREFKERSIKKATFTLIGAVTNAVIGFYDNVAREYRNKEFKEMLEIASCIGNVSEKDGDIFVHAHVVLGKQDYSCVGGHLMPGTTIFAAELFGYPVPGAGLVRKFDEPTGLALWAD
jgi:hypothetical protein